MSLFENTSAPAAPYFLASILAMWAYLHSFELHPVSELVLSKFYGGVDEKPITDYLVSLFNNKNLSKGVRNQAMYAMYGWNSEEGRTSQAVKFKLAEILKNTID